MHRIGTLRRTVFMLPMPKWLLPFVAVGADNRNQIEQDLEEIYAQMEAEALEEWTPVELWIESLSDEVEREFARLWYGYAHGGDQDSEAEREQLAMALTTDRIRAIKDGIMERA